MEKDQKPGLSLDFEIYFAGEPAAGLNGFSDTVSISVESGDPGGDPGEFAKFMRESLAEWYDGARVELRIYCEKPQNVP